MRKDAMSRCSKQYIDYSLPNSLPSNFSIVFQNYFSKSISITDDANKVLIDSYQLMKNASCESEGQNWHQIKSSTFKSPINPSRPLRIYFEQASNMWIKYEIRNVKIVFGKDGNNGESTSSDSKSRRNSLNTSSEPIVTMTENIFRDWNVLSEQVSFQSRMKGLSEYNSSNCYGNDGRRQMKRSSSRNKTRRISSAATSTIDAGVGSTL